MPVFNVLTLLGFGFGTALTTILFVLSMQKTPKRAGDIAFGILFLACIVWLGGNFLALFLQLLFGSVAMSEANLFALFAYIGLAAIPSSLMHVQITMLLHAQGTLMPWYKKRTLSFVLLYAPAFLFVGLAIPTFSLKADLTPWQTTSVNLSFVIWIIMALVISIAISEKLVRIIHDDSDRHFYRDITVVLSVIGVGLIAVYVVPLYRLAYVGSYLDLIMLLSPAYPMGLLLYYVYRYNFYRLVIKPSLIYSIIYGSFMAFYLLVIRRFGEYLRQFPEVNAAFIEGLLLVAMVFAFQPFRARFQERLDKILFKDRFYYQQFLRELSDSISGIVDLERLLETISNALVNTLRVKTCTIVVFQYKNEQLEIVKMHGASGFYDLGQLIHALSTTRYMRLRRQIRDHRVVSALDQNQFDLAVPIYVHDTMTGLICLSEKQTGNAYTDEELDVLQTFANQIALAIENARLFQDRLNLEGRVYQSEKLNSLGQLATTMSHEIKNPLSSIKTIVQVLREKSSGEDAEDLDIVINEINRLNTILEKLLSFARPSTGTTERMQIQDVILDVVALFKHQARKADIEFVLDLKDVPPIRARLQSIREVVFNLTLNAMQAQPDGGEIRITIRTTSETSATKSMRSVHRQEPLSWIELTISDRGPGIPESVQHQIFEPFYTSKQIGTGLGLPIVKRNAEDIGGVVKVNSKTEGGTVFTVLIPVNSKSA